MQELCPDLSPDEYVDFDAAVSTGDAPFETDALDWRQQSRTECMDKAANPQPTDQEVISDESYDEECIGPNIVEILAMLDKICTSPALDGTWRYTSMDGSIVTITRTLETLRLNQKQNKNV